MDQLSRQEYRTLTQTLIFHPIQKFQGSIEPARIPDSHSVIKQHATGMTTDQLSRQEYRTLTGITNKLFADI